MATIWQNCYSNTEVVAMNERSWRKSVYLAKRNSERKKCGEMAKTINIESWRKSGWNYQAVASWKLKAGEKRSPSKRKAKKLSISHETQWNWRKQSMKWEKMKTENIENQCGES